MTDFVIELVELVELVLSVVTSFRVKAIWS